MDADDPVRVDLERDLDLDLVDSQANTLRTSLRIFIYALSVMRSAGGLHEVQSTIATALESELRMTLEQLTSPPPLHITAAGQQPHVPPAEPAAANSPPQRDDEQ